jgi:hypothetical protein
MTSGAQSASGTKPSRSGLLPSVLGIWLPGKFRLETCNCFFAFTSLTEFLLAMRVPTAWLWFNDCFS